MRGVIMETKNGRAVLLTKGGGFMNIRDKGYSMGDKVNITPNTGRLCATTASIIVVCAGIGSHFVPAGYVSVDINPSLMLTLNPYNRVINVQSFNDDARVLLSRTDIDGKSAEKSVEMLIKASEEIGYINDDNRDVLLEVVPGMIKPNMEKIQHNNIELTNEIADKEILRISQDIGVSIAKAKAIEEYTEKNGGDIHSNAVKFNNKSAKEMRDIISDNSHLSDKKTPKTPLKERKDENISETPKPQKNTTQNYKPSYNINDNKSSVNQPQTPEKKSDNSGNHGKPQQNAPKHEETMSQNNSKPKGQNGKGERSQDKTPKQKGSQNDGNNLPSNKNAGGHN